MIDFFVMIARFFMAIGSSLKNEPQARALRSAPEHAVEALEHALAFCVRYAATGVLHNEPDDVGIGRNAHRNMATALGIAQGVIENVVQHLAQEECIAFDDGGILRPIEPEIDVAAMLEDLE